MDAVTACTPPTMAVQVGRQTLPIMPLMFAPGPDRIDIVVWQQAVHTPRPAPWVVYGVPSYQPLPPTLTDNDAVTQIPLAYVHVAAGQAAIMDCHITPIVDDRIPAILYELARR